MLKFYNRAAVIAGLSLMMLAILPQTIYAEREVRNIISYCDPAIPEPQTAEEAAKRRENCKGSTPSSEDAGLIEKYGNPFLIFLGSIVGLVVTISIVAAGIQYASSAGDPNKIAAARIRIMNAIIALVAFLFLYGFLQWLIPGGFI